MSDSAPATGPEPGRQRSPTAPTRGLTLLAACVGLEGAVLVLVGIGVLVSLVAGAGGDTGLFLALVALFGLYGGVLLLAARAILRRRRWARSLGILSQLISVLMVKTIIDGGLWVVAVPLLLVSAPALLLVLAPSVGGLLVEDSATDEARD